MLVVLLSVVLVAVVPVVVVPVAEVPVAAVPVAGVPVAEVLEAVVPCNLGYCKVPVVPGVHMCVFGIVPVLVQRCVFASFVCFPVFSLEFVSVI